MKIRHSHTIVMVQDIKTSVAFYTGLLGLGVEKDFGSIVFLEGDFALHQANELIQTVYKEDRQSARLQQGHDNLLIYFETEELKGAYERIAAAGVPIIHPIERQHWGQLVFRFNDPDGHIVEIGEPL